VFLNVFPGGEELIPGDQNYISPPFSAGIIEGILFQKVKNDS
jgi:hypothetical protein